MSGMVAACPCHKRGKRHEHKRCYEGEFHGSLRSRRRRAECAPMRYNAANDANGTCGGFEFDSMAGHVKHLRSAVEDMFIIARYYSCVTKWANRSATGPRYVF